MYHLTLTAVCCEVLACQEESQLSPKACLFCRADSVSLEDVHCQKEADPSEAGGHHPPGTLQGTTGSKEIRRLAGEVQGREGEKEKRGGATEKEEGEGKARSSEERKLVVFVFAPPCVVHVHNILTFCC